MPSCRFGLPAQVGIVGPIDGRETSPSQPNVLVSSDLSRSDGE